MNGMGPRRVRRWRTGRGLPRFMASRSRSPSGQLCVRPVDGHGAVVVRLQDAELGELGEPAWGVALDHERLVVDLGVTVGLTVAQHREDGSRQLVGGGDDGAFVAPANDECLVVGVELAVPGTRGAVGAAVAMA